MELKPTRREVLKSGLLAGAGVATGLSPGALMQALAGTSCGGQLTDIQHVIILIQENRSFDHYFGRYKGVRGFGDTSVSSSVFAQSYDRSLEPVAVPDPLFPFHIDTAFGAPPKPGECTNDIDHQWATQHRVWNGGLLDQWMPAHITANGATDAVITMGYYQGSPARDHSGDLDFYWALADNFTICDHYHCSAIGGTDINRLYSISGSLDPDGWDGGLQFLDTQDVHRSQYSGTFGTASDPASRWTPYPEALSRAGVSWKIYSTPDGHTGDNVLSYFKDFQPGSPLYANAFSSQAFPNDFISDVQTGSLPQVSWLLANLPDTEHAPAPLEWGQAITQQVLNALVGSGLWASSALFLTWDENGGFFDHVAPRVPAAHVPGEFLTGTLGPTAQAESGGILGPIGLGFRVPMLVVSPFSHNPKPSSGPMISSVTYDHTSILRFLETRFRVPIPMRDPAKRRPGLSLWRRRAVGDLSRAFNFAHDPITTAPSLPTTNRSDPRVLSECVVTGTPGTLNAHTSQIAEGYPGPYSTAVPSQEPFQGRVKRPSGPC